MDTQSSVVTKKSRRQYFRAALVVVLASASLLTTSKEASAANYWVKTVNRSIGTTLQSATSTQTMANCLGMRPGERMTISVTHFFRYLGNGKIKLERFRLDARSDMGTRIALDFLRTSDGTSIVSYGTAITNFPGVNVYPNWTRTLPTASTWTDFQPGYPNPMCGFNLLIGFK